jgi:integrase
LKQKIGSNNGYLFVLRQIDDSYLQNLDEEIRKITENSIQKMYRAISSKAKKNTQRGTYNTIRSHNMRKYFNSTLLSAGCDSFHVEYFMGHELDNTSASIPKWVPCLEGNSLIIGQIKKQGFMNILWNQCTSTVTTYL